MSNDSLLVYGTAGEIKYPIDKSGKNIDIQSAWTAKRRLVVKNKSNGGVVLQCYLRAITGTHKEQLYIQFSADSSKRIFERFSQAVNTHLLEDLGWELQNHQKNRLIRSILTFEESQEKTSPLDKILLLLEDDQDIKSHTNNYTKAIQLTHELINRGCDVTIADNSEALKYCDVGIAVNPQYQSQITLSDDNETYYRQKQESLKQKKLRESLVTTVQKYRSEMSDEALIDQFGEIIADTEYQISTKTRDPNQEEAEDKQPLKSKPDYSLYPLLSYGVNIIVGVLLSLYLFEGALNYWGLSIAQTVGTSIEMTLIVMAVFLIGYGSLGALWATSHLSSSKAGFIGFICMTLSLFAGGVVSILGGSYVPSTIAGFPWWILLSVLPPIAGLAEAVRNNTQAWSADIGDESVFPFNLPPVLGAAGGIFVGFVIGNIAIESISTNIIYGAAINQIVVGVLTVILTGGILYLWMEGNYERHIQTAVITMITLSGGIAIFTVVLRFDLLPGMELLLYKILAGAGLALVTFMTTGYIGHTTSLFEAPEKLLILYPKEDDTITQPEFEIKILNELSVNWVTVKLNKDGDLVDSNMIEYRNDDSQNNLQTVLSANENGDHIIQAYTGKGEYSGHRGGKDQTEISIEGIADFNTSAPQVDYATTKTGDTKNNSLDTTEEALSDSQGDNSNPSEFDTGEFEADTHTDESSSPEETETIESSEAESGGSNSENDSWEIK